MLKYGVSFACLIFALATAVAISAEESESDQQQGLSSRGAAGGSNGEHDQSSRRWPVGTEVAVDISENGNSVLAVPEGVSMFSEWVAGEAVVADEGEVCAKVVNSPSTWLVVSQAGAFYDGRQVLSAEQVESPLDCDLNELGNYMVASSAGVYFNGELEVSGEYIDANTPVSVSLNNHGRFVFGSSKGVFWGRIGQEVRSVNPPRN